MSVVEVVHTVHTTGINYQSLIAVGAEVRVIVAAFAGLIARSVRGSVRHEIHEVLREDVTPALENIRDEQRIQAGELKLHDTRIAKLEGIEEGKRQAVAQAKLIHDGSS